MVLMMSMLGLRSALVTKRLIAGFACALVIVVPLAAPAVARPSEVADHIDVDNVVHTDSSNGVVDYAQVAGSMIALLALLALLYQIARSRRESQGQRAFDLQTAYTSREFRSVTSRSLAFLDANDARDCVQKVRAWEFRGWADNPCLPRSPRQAEARPSANDIVEVFSFLEALGALYRHKEVARKVLLDIFATPPVEMFMAGWWFICWLRGGLLVGETETYRHYQWFVQEIRLRRETSGAASPKAEIAVLCLPEDLHEEQDARWRRCEELSVRISRLAMDTDMVRAMETIEREMSALKRQVTTGDPFGVTLLPIPSAIDVDPDGWAAVRRATSRAERCLNAGGTTGVDALIAKLPA
jgi:hypothetical protein